MLVIFFWCLLKAYKDKVLFQVFRKFYQNKLITIKEITGTVHTELQKTLCFLEGFHVEAAEHAARFINDNITDWTVPQKILWHHCSFSRHFRYITTTSAGEKRARLSFEETVENFHVIPKETKMIFHSALFNRLYFLMVLGDRCKGKKFLTPDICISIRNMFEFSDLVPGGAYGLPCNPHPYFVKLMGDKLKKFFTGLDYLVIDELYHDISKGVEPLTDQECQFYICYDERNYYNLINLFKGDIRLKSGLINPLFERPIFDLNLLMEVVKPEYLNTFFNLYFKESSDPIITTSIAPLPAKFFLTYMEKVKTDAYSYVIKIHAETLRKELKKADSVKASRLVTNLLNHEDFVDCRSIKFWIRQLRFNQRLKVPKNAAAVVRKLNHPLLDLLSHHSDEQIFRLLHIILDNTWLLG